MKFGAIRFAMKFSKTFSGTILVAFLTAIAPGAAFAASAQDYLKEKQVTLTGLVSADADSPKVAAAFDELLDYGALAKASLGDEQWGKLTQAERDEFRSLLTTLVQRAYKKSIRETLAYQIDFLGQSDIADGKLVKTVAKHKTDERKPSVKIDYLVHEVAGKWRIYDIVTEDVSLVSNYKSQFKQVIAKKEFSGLLEVMRKKSQEK